MIRTSGGDHLFLDPRTFPSREDAPRNKPRRVTHSVVRVLTPWKGGTSKHVKAALARFLSHPANLPPDPGAGPYPVAARLDPAMIAKAMRLSGEPSRAAFIRRVLTWKYFQRPTVASAKPAALVAAKPSPVAVKQVAPPVAVPGLSFRIPFGEPVAAQPVRSMGVGDVPAPKNVSDQEYIRRLYEGKI